MGTGGGVRLGPRASYEPDLTPGEGGRLYPQPNQKCEYKSDGHGSIFYCK